VRQIIAELERDGQDAEQARSLLDTFVALQMQHVAHRDRLIEELGGADDELARPSSAH